MSSIRNAMVLISVGVMSLGVGCRKKQPAQPVMLNPNEIQVDDAMQKRNWDQTKATYTRTSVAAGPDRFAYEPTSGTAGRWLDTPLFIFNSALLPFTYFNDGPSAEVQNTTVIQGPSYTAVPPTEGGSGGIMLDYGGRTPKSRVAPANAPGSLGTGGATPARGGGGVNAGSGGGSGTSGK